MADGFYDNARDELLKGNIDLVNDTIKVVLVDADDYTVDLATHDFLDDIAAGARVATGTLGTKTVGSVAAGVFDAADTTLSAVSGDQSEALVIYKDTGVEGTSPLICYIDSYTGLPVTPNGGDITIAWPSGGIITTS